MFPTLFQLGPLTISSYGAMMAAAFFLTVWMASSAAAGSLRGHVPMTPDALGDWACWAIVGGILGGRLLYVALNWEVYASEPQEIFALWHGGLIWYGGFAGGLLATAIYLRRHRYGFLQGTDQVMPFIALGHAIGRVGCFFNGCCYGKPTTAWFGVMFPGHAEAVVPTQLIESAALVGLFFILRKLQTPAALRRPGTVFGAYLVGYALIRWTVEFWRDHQPIVLAGLTLHQIISAVLFAVGVGLILRARAPASCG